jgi:hypothetical protein
MTSTERLNLARNVQAHIRALQAAVDRLTEMGAHEIGSPKRPVHCGLSLRSDGSGSVLVKVESVSFRNRRRGSRASSPIQ